MIVRCPACQTQFNVDPALVGPGGRKVRCAKCANVWRMGPDGMPMASGPFGLRPPAAQAAETAAPEARGTAPAAAPPPASAMTPQAEASGAPAPDSTSGKPPLWGRGPNEREKRAERPEAAAETPGSAAEEAQEGAASDAAKADLPTAADANAGAKARQKGGRKLKLFLLLLCLVVIALFAAAVLTGRFEPGGIVPASKAPSTRDVAPPASDIGIPGSRLAPAERGGPLIGRVQ